MARHLGLVVFFALLSMAMPSRGEPLDVVGIKTGMTFAQASAAITAHNPRIKTFWPARGVNDVEVAKTHAYAVIQLATVAGLTPFVDTITSLDEGPKFNMTIPTMPTIESETIRVLFTPATPNVVYGIQREITYRPGQFAGRVAVLNALIEKYGPISQPQGFTVTTEIIPSWFLGPNGKPLAGVPPGCSGTGSLVTGWGAMSLHASIAANQAKCGPYVRASLLYDPGNPELLRYVEVRAIDAPVMFSRARAAQSLAEESSRQQKIKEAQEAEKRGGGKF
jgi:hypothetical protein